MFKRVYENNYINYIILCLICMNFKQSGSTIFVLFCIINFLMIGRIVLNKKMIPYIFIIIGMIISIISNSGTNAYNEMIKAFNYVLPFIIGYNGYKKSCNKVKYMERVIFFMFLGYILQIVFVYFYNLGLGSSGRVLVSIWTHEEMSVTLVGLLSSFVIAYSLSVLAFYKNKFLKATAIAGCIFCILINSQTSTRTPFLMFIVVAFGLIMASNVGEKAARKGRVLFTISLVAIIGIMFFSLNLFNIQNVIMDSPIFERFTEKSIETTRGDIIEEYFGYMFEYYSGGSNVRRITGQSAHNIWQEFYDIYGVFPAVFLLVILISMIKQFLKMIKLKNKTSLDFTIISIYLATLVQCFMEPIVTGYPILFWGLVFIHGISTVYYKDRIDGSLLKEER